MDIKAIKQKVSEKKIKIAVFGLGRIGLPTAVEFAYHNFQVIGVDVNFKLLNDLKQSHTFIDEPHLDEYLKECNDKHMMEYSDDSIYAINNSDIIVICLPTPINDDMGPDYSIIESVAHQIGKNLKLNQIVIVESSVSPTTLENLIAPILENESDLKLNTDFAICSCPERADPGKIIENFDKVPRIVGGSNWDVTKIIADFYRSITSAEIIEVTSPGTANAIKLTENIFRDVNIALINELAVLFEMLGIDIKEVIAGCSTKYNFQPHYPGPGVGGPCLPANPYYIIKDAVKVNYIPFLIRVAREVNDRMPEHVVGLITQSLNEISLPINGTSIGILGISYKANVRDIQISPSVKVINLLQQLGAELRIFDPYYAGEDVENFHVLDNLDEAFQGTKAVAVLTDHAEFRQIDFKKYIDGNKNLIIIDSRNIYNTDRFPSGTIYCGVGRPLQKVK